MDIQVLKLEDAFVGYQIPNAFTKTECEIIINFAENIGFLDQNVNKFGQTFRDVTKRTDKNIGVSDPFLQFMMTSRLGKLLDLLKTVYYKGGKTDKFVLHDFLRISKYVAGNVCQPHIDAQIKMENATSKFTLMLYLNDSDGLTRFFDVVTMKHVDIKPEMGKVLVFDQQIAHSALPPTSVKYVLRMDVLEQLLPPPSPVKPSELSVNRRGID